MFIFELAFIGSVVMVEGPCFTIVNYVRKLPWLKDLVLQLCQKAVLVVLLLTLRSCVHVLVLVSHMHVVYLHCPTNPEWTLGPS